jgi:hypothetical protein
MNLAELSLNNAADLAVVYAKGGLSGAATGRLRNAMYLTSMLVRLGGRDSHICSANRTRSKRGAKPPES